MNVTKKKKKLTQNRIRFVELHPISYKQLFKGHPWVLKDEFTEKFPSEDDFIYAKYKNTTYTFLHDPNHPQIKARLWDKNLVKIQEVLNQLSLRLEIAFNQKIDYLDQRNHFYLLFGESDFVPGLKILYLNKIILVHIEAYFWKKLINKIHPILKSHLLSNNFEFDKIIYQDRFNSKEVHFYDQKQKPIPPISFFIQEEKFKMKGFIGEHYDHGFYTDMANLRERLKSLIPSQKSKALNLFSYTGAFTLWAYSQGFIEVHSNDLSKKYISILEENLELNEIDQNNHQSLVGAADKILDRLSSSENKYDLIISDPPSAFTNKKNRSNVLKFYQDNLARMLELTNRNGYLYLFKNTHKIPFKKFNDIILKACKNKAKVVSSLKLGGDCKQLKHFKEGDYLNCIILRKL